MASLVKGIFIVGAKRTPFGAYGGKLTKLSAIELQVLSAKAALSAANVPAEKIDSVTVGNVISSSSADGPYMARHVGLKCGVPIAAPALTVNRLCGSGFQAVVSGAHDIIMGDGKIVLTGGTDNMSAAPHITRGLRFGVSLGVEPVLEDCLWASLTDMHIKTPMGLTAENLAEKYKITRSEADAFALKSQTNWAKGYESGAFDDEMVPIELKSRKGVEIMKMDEHPKPKATIEGLAKLKSVFKKDGTVTAGTASGICDGAGALVLASEEACKEHNLKPLARLVGYGIAGVDPKIMGIGPAPAINKVLKIANMSLKDIDMVEINEAFAPQTLACMKELDLDPERLNIHGGAVALGHPLAASGARITAHIVHALRRQNFKYGIGSACIGGGQGIALLLEKM